MGLKVTNLIEAAQLTDDEAREYLEQIRWPDGPICPHCDNAEKVYELNGKAHRPGLYKCGACRKQFTGDGRDDHAPFALGSYKTAWHMAHRIRLAMREDPLAGLLKGVVEVDEVYVGARKPRYKGHSKRGRGTKKTPVVVLVERDGRARSHPLERVTGKNLKAAVRTAVDPTAHVITDELPAYRLLSREHPGGHSVIKHSSGQYADGDKHTNTAESYNALLKRGIIGQHHHVGKKHLGRYCDEFSFRWNHRTATDGQRTEVAIRQVGGKRLTYKTPRKLD